MKNLKVFKNNFKTRGPVYVLCAGLIAATLTGCGKKADCEIKPYHAHKYINKGGYTRYLDKEYLSYEGYDRQEDFLELDKDEKDLYKFYDKKDLMKIADNVDVILEQEEQNQDFVEYRYRYTTLLPILHTMHVGKTTTTYFTYIPVTHHSWTTDKNHSRLTGEERLCHYVYQGYKIEKNQHGKYVLIPSPQVDSVEEIASEYPYITKNYYKAVDIKYGNPLDYEDGQAEDDEHYTKEDDIPLDDAEDYGNTTEKGKQYTK